MASSNKINIVIKADDQASKPLRDVSDEMDKGAGKASKFKTALGSLGGVLAKTTVAVALAAAAAGTAGATIGIGFNNSVEQAQTKLTAFMGDGEKVAKTLAWVKKEAAATQFSFTDMADAAANLTPVAKSSGVALEDLVKQAEVLASINPSEGLTGATFSLREALSGDWVSIVDRFNLPRKRINELKAQGVPAMEIISRTLKEMGIDYGLVAKQGQTTAARFDQIKDKLTMMAGAATKPIFDRISTDLDKLSGFNFDALGEKMARTFTRALEAADAFIPKVVEVGKQVGDYLGPKFEALWAAVTERLGPALSKLWREVLEPLVPVLGVALVAAVGLVVDALTIATNIISGTINALTWLWQELEAGNPVIWGLVGVLGTLAGAMALSTGLSAMHSAAAVVTGTIIPRMALAYSGFAAMVASPIVFPALLIGAALASIAAVVKAYQEARSALQSESNAIDAEAKTSKQLLDYANKQRAAGKISAAEHQRLVKVATRTYATGTNYAPGGMSVVGEHGPEVMYVPRGAQVMPNYRSEPAPVASGHTVIIENYNSYNERDDRRFFRDIGFALEAA